MNDVTKASLALAAARRAEAEARPAPPTTGSDGVLIDGDGIVRAAVFGHNGVPPEGLTLVVGAEAWPEAVPGLHLAWPRTQRHRLLTESDYMDAPGWRALHPDQLQIADAYRDALRNLPASQPDPAAVVWPAYIES